MFSITTVELFLKIALSRNSQGERDDVWSHCVSTTYQLIRDCWRSRSFVMKEKYDSKVTILSSRKRAPDVKKIRLSSPRSTE